MPDRKDRSDIQPDTSRSGELFHFRQMIVFELLELLGCQLRNGTTKAAVPDHVPPLISIFERIAQLFRVHLDLREAHAAKEGQALLAPYAVAMVIGAAVAALSGIVSFIGLRHVGGSKRKAAAAA